MTAEPVLWTTRIAHLSQAEEGHVKPFPCDFPTPVTSSLFPGKGSHPQHPLKGFLLGQVGSGRLRKENWEEFSPQVHTCPAAAKSHLEGSSHGCRGSAAEVLRQASAGLELMGAFLPTCQKPSQCSLSGSKPPWTRQASEGLGTCLSPTTSAMVQPCRFRREVFTWKSFTAAYSLWNVPQDAQPPNGWISTHPDWDFFTAFVFLVRRVCLSLT